MSNDAAMISVCCPGCGKRFSVAAQFAGRRGKCKSCGSEVPIPANPSAAVEDDLYDFVPDNKPARPPAAVLVAEAAVAPVLGYSGPAPRKAGRSGQPEDFDPFDPFEGNKFKNLYLPLILILGTAAFNLLAETSLKHNASMGIVAASARMVGKLAVEIPIMLVACFLAVKLMDAAYGPLGTAILKLSSIALTPDAVQDLFVLVGFIIGHASGNLTNMAVDVGIWMIFGWLLSLILYFWLFMYYFDLELGEAWRLIIFIWFVRLVFTWLVLMFVGSWLFSR